MNRTLSEGSDHRWICDSQYSVHFTMNHWRKTMRLHEQRTSLPLDYLKVEDFDWFSFNVQLVYIFHIKLWAIKTKKKDMHNQMHARCPSLSWLSSWTLHDGFFFFLDRKGVPTLVYIFPYTSCEVYNDLRKVKKNSGLGKPLELSFS